MSRSFAMRHEDWMGASRREWRARIVSFRTRVECAVYVLRESDISIFIRFFIDSLFVFQLLWGMEAQSHIFHSSNHSQEKTACRVSTERPQFDRNF
jgi:hypothetical protein